MIHFFRRIRQGLLSQNRFSKYLLYAIGEIILVMIGILLALNINNANTNQQNRLTSELLLKEQLPELESNIDRCMEILEYYHWHDSINLLYEENKLTDEDFRSGRLGYNVTMLFSDLDLQDKSYQSLMRSLDKMPDDFKPVIRKLNTLYTDLKLEVHDNNEAIKQNVFEDIQYLKENKPWFAHTVDSRRNNMDYLDFFVRSWEFRNRQKFYFTIAVNNLVPSAIRFRRLAIEVHNEINNILGLYPDDNSFMLSNPKPEILGKWRLQTEEKDTLIIEISEKDRQYLLTVNELFTRELIPLPNGDYMWNISYGTIDTSVDNELNVEIRSGSKANLVLRRIAKDTIP